MSAVITLSAIPATGGVGATVVLSGNATENGTPIVGVAVQLWLDGAQLKYVETDYSGT